MKRDRDDYLVGKPTDFFFSSPSREVLEMTLVHENGDLTLRGPGGTMRLEKGTSTWERYTGYLADQGIEPREADLPKPKGYISWDDKDQLLQEVVMDIPRSQSKVKRTPEVDALRRTLVRQVREIEARGNMAEGVKD
jgi:hypothetical protein